MYNEIDKHKGWRTKRANRYGGTGVIYGNTSNTSNTSNKDLRARNHRPQEEKQDERQYVHNLRREDERRKVD